MKSSSSRARRAPHRFSIVLASVIIALFFTRGAHAGLGDQALAAHVRELTLQLSTKEAAERLLVADPNDRVVALERARLHLYTGDCDQAFATLVQHDLLDEEMSKALGGAARGCMSATAGSVVFTDDASGSWVRLSDGEDAALLPLVYDVVAKSRVLFEKELQVVMPRPIRIDLVRDQFSLSKMTGLPLSAARTTGTIGIAKWGRVIMVSPRAAEGGYGFLDTLAHELTHLALARASTDQAPLWLQEGVARRLESVWREPSPFDDTPRALDVASFGLKNAIGPEIDAIGPSIALLPSALEAQITYAKVQSFMTYYSDEAGPPALNKLLAECKGGSAEMDRLVEAASSRKFSEWKDAWKAHVLAEGKEIDEALRPGAKPPIGLAVARRNYRLGELLLDRGHGSEAALELDRAHRLMPRDAAIRGLHARARLRADEAETAKALVASVEDVSTGDPNWWSLRSALVPEDEERSGRFAVMGAPYDPIVVCEEHQPPYLPADPARATLCTAAREKPRAR